MIINDENIDINISDNKNIDCNSIFIMTIIIVMKKLLSIMMMILIS